MSPLQELLAAEILRDGPIPFRRFMETALYHPTYGYYRPTRDPFGKAGDFYTAEQVQPVFGILMAARIRQLYRELGEPPDFTVVELGAGRREMAGAFSEWRYIPVDIGSGELPAHFTGVAFSNEFFDALPVEAAIFHDGRFHRQCVGFAHGRFTWHTGDEAPAEVDRYLRQYFPPPEEGRSYEVNLAALEWIERIARTLDQGYVLTVDYGYTCAESVRFPAGTLMGYHRHTAREDVLEDPGSRDITAHVNFTALEEAGKGSGLRTVRFETLAQTLLTAGEPDRFCAALGGDPSGDLRRRMQLKTLLFGMGETFRVLLQAKERRASALEGGGDESEGKALNNEKGPENRGL
jgi:SAM-dependent MidA family methyltransferase